MKYIPDTYTLKARIAPFFLVSLPLILVALCWHAEEITKWETLRSIIWVSGGGMLFAQLGRSRGKVLEPRLFENWGGKPTTIKLRMMNSPNSEIVKRYHDNIAQLLPNIQLPTPEEEIEDTKRADNVYDSIVRFLITKTRDIKKFSLLFNENCNYGFRRNLWGLKIYGILLATLGCIIELLIIFIDYFHTKNVNDVDLLKIVCLVVNMFLCYIWYFIITKNWVKVAADAYADRLLESSEILVE